MIYDKLIIVTEVDNVQEFMRAILSKEEVVSLILNIYYKNSIWIDDDNARSREFKNIVKNNITKDFFTYSKLVYTYE